MLKIRTHFFLGMLLVFQANCQAEIDVESYVNNSQIQWVWAILGLDEVEISKDDHILDLGCADGKLSAHLSTLVPKGSVLGIDPLQEGIEYAEKHHASSNLNFSVEDATKLDFKEEFNLVTSFCSLNWIEDKASVLEGAYKALLSGGKMLIVLPAPYKPNPKARKFFSMFQEERWLPYMHLFKRLPGLSSDEWIHLAEENGFSVEKIEAIKTPGVFHDEKDMKNWLYALKPDLYELPVSLQEEYFDAYRSVVSMTYPQAGDGRIYGFPERLVIVLKKK